MIKRPHSPDATSHIVALFYYVLPANVRSTHILYGTFGAPRATGVLRNSPPGRVRSLRSRRRVHFPQSEGAREIQQIFIRGVAALPCERGECSSYAQQRHSDSSSSRSSWTNHPMGNANATGVVPAVGETARQQLEEQPLPAQDAASSTPGHTQHGGDEQSHGHIQSLDSLPAPAIACTSLSPSSHMATTAVTSALAPAAIVTGGFDQTSSVSLPVAALHALAIGAAATVSSSESLAYSSTSAESGGELVATAAEAATAASMATPASMTIKRTTTALKDYDGPSRTAVESTSFKSTSSSSSGGGTAALRILGAGSLGTSSSSLGGATSPFSPRSASGPTAAQRLLGGASFRSAQPAPVVSIGSTVSSMDGNASAVRDAVSTTSYTQHGPATSIDATMLFSSATLNAPLCGSPLMTPSNFSSYSADPLRHASQVRESRRESVTSLPSGQSPSSHSGSLERGKTGGLTTSVDVDTRRGGEIGLGSMSTATASTTTSASGTLARGTADDDRTVPLILTWTLGGREVFVTGTFNDWRERIQLAKGYVDGASFPRFRVIISQTFIFLSTERMILQRCST